MKNQRIVSALAMASSSSTRKGSPMKRRTLICVIAAIIVGTFGCGTAPTTSPGTSDSAPALDTTRPVVADAATRVTIDAGQIVGGFTDASKAVATWRDIPFAASPTGDLRWKPPAPVTHWSGVRDCTQWGDSPEQPRQSGSAMYTPDFQLDPGSNISEDALNLNVWSDMSADTKSRCSSTSTAAASRPAGRPSRCTTAPAWPSAASSM